MKALNNTYVISDIHNDYDSFMDMLGKIDFSGNDMMYIVGDIFDRSINPKPLELYKAIRCRANIVPILGNHDRWLCRYILRYLENNNDEPYWYNSFDILEKQMSNQQLYELAVWIDNMPLQLEIQDENGEKYLLAHAQTFSPDENIADESAFTMGRFIDKEYLENGVEGYTSVIGHHCTSLLRTWMGWKQTVNLEVFANKNRNVFGIDVGNGYRNTRLGHRLACMRLEDKNIFYI